MRSNLLLPFELLLCIVCGISVGMFFRHGGIQMSMCISMGIFGSFAVPAVLGCIVFIIQDIARWWKHRNDPI